jgi:hypothetical protein
MQKGRKCPLFARSRQSSSCNDEKLLDGRKPVYLTI